MSTEEQPIIPESANTNNKARGSMMDRIKNSFKRHTLWWIIGIIVVVVIIGLIIWGIVALAKRGECESFVAFDKQSDPNVKELNIEPEMTYLQSYISTALNIPIDITNNNNNNNSEESTS